MILLTQYQTLAFQASLFDIILRYFSYINFQQPEFDVHICINLFASKGISICPNNLISQITIAVVVDVALFMNRAAAADKVKDGEVFFLNGIRYSAKLYDFDASDDFDYLAFHRILKSSSMAILQL